MKLKEEQCKRWNEILEQLNLLRINEKASLSSSGLSALDAIQQKLLHQKQELESSCRASIEKSLRAFAKIKEQESQEGVKLFEGLNDGINLGLNNIFF